MDFTSVHILYILLPFFWRIANIMKAVKKRAKMATVSLSRVRIFILSVPLGGFYFVKGAVGQVMRRGWFATRLYNLEGSYHFLRE